MIESVIETKHWRTTAPESGTISGSAGSNAIVGVGTVFLTDVAINDIIVSTDSLGRRVMGWVASVGDNLNLTFVNNLINAIPAGSSFSIIKVNDKTQAFFRADNSVNRSPVIQPTVLSALGVQSQAAFLSEINRNEGAFVKSVYIRMPFQYTLADSYFLLSFEYMNTSGAGIGPIRAIGEDGFFQIPGENIEIPVNNFVPTPLAAGTSRWQIGVQVNNALGTLGTPYVDNDFDIAAVSQVNGPSSLNGQLLPIYIGMRILHANTALL